MFSRLSGFTPDDLKRVVSEAVSEAVRQAFSEYGTAYMKLDSTSNFKSELEEPLLDTDSAAQFLYISKSKLYKDAREGSIPSHKRGRRLYFLKSELKQWALNEGRVIAHDRGCEQMDASVDNGAIRPEQNGGETHQPKLNGGDRLKISTI
jgi:excisionase family DNA binding protein